MNRHHLNPLGAQVEQYGGEKAILSLELRHLSSSVLRHWSSWFTGFWTPELIVVMYLSLLLPHFSGIWLELRLIPMTPLVHRPSDLV